MFVIQVVGKSMEPAIPEGSYCLFRTPVEGTRQGKTVLVQLRDATDPETDQRYTVKRYRSRMAPAEREEDEATRTDRRNLGRLRKGIRTQESTHYAPVLETFVELGGGSKLAEVLDRVGQKMDWIFEDVDRQPLASDPSNPRWRNAAQWARHGMVQEGLLKADSPRGVWEISDLGRAYLRESQ